MEGQWRTVILTEDLWLEKILNNYDYQSLKRLVIIKYQRDTTAELLAVVKVRSFPQASCEENRKNWK